MSEDKKVYSREDFALILRRAAELASASEVSPKRPADLSLDDMKAIAAEAGLDPALIERAAYVIPSESGGSLLGRMLGRQRLSASFPSPLTQERTAHVLSVIKADTEWMFGEATASGLFWGKGGLSVTMHNEAGVSRAQVTWNPTLALVIAGILGLSSVMLVVVNGSDTFGTFIGSIVVGSGVALGTWAAFARRAKKRVGALMDTICRAMVEVGDSPEVSEDRKANLRPVSREE